MSKTILDLDDMLTRVPVGPVREYIREAIACYHGGALRAAIVTTWTAVVFDIIDKIRALDLAGDANAKKHLQKLETIRADNDVMGSMQMERDILGIAHTEFEFLTHQEHLDLERLREDRHRCAHPSMDQLGEAYQPPPELVRYHLRTAITALLTRPPTQGKAAFSRLVGEIQSPLFPTNVDGALRVLRAGPLQHPREALLRSFIVASFKAVLLEPDTKIDSETKARVITALCAVRVMHPEVSRIIFATTLTDVSRNIPGESLSRVLKVLTKIPDLWHAVPQDVLTKLSSLVQSAAGDAVADVVPDSAQGPGLEEVTKARTAVLTKDEITKVIARHRKAALVYPPLVDRAIELFLISASWENTNAIVSGAIRPLLPALTRSHIELILKAAIDNTEVRFAWATPILLQEIRDSGVVEPSLFDELIDSSGLAAVFELSEKAPQTPASTEKKASPLVVGTRVRHKIFGVGVIQEVMGTGRDEKVFIEFEVPAHGKKAIKSAYTTLVAVTDDA